VTFDGLSVLYVLIYRFVWTALGTLLQDLRNKEHVGRCWIRKTEVESIP
jgi:hypothetical protein